MNNLFKAVLCVIFAVVMLTLGAFASDIGYYDATDDGKVEVTDVLVVLKEVINTHDTDLSLISVLKTLKVAVSSDIVTATVTSVDCTNKTATLSCNYLSEFEVPLTMLGIVAGQGATLFEQADVIMTVPSPAADFFASFDASLIYAAKCEPIYDSDTLKMTVGSKIAYINGEETEIDAAPIIYNGTVMGNIRVISEFLDLSVAWDGNTSTATLTSAKTTLKMTVEKTAVYVNGVETEIDVPMIIVDSRGYFPIDFVAGVFDAATTWNELTDTVSVVKPYYPTITFEAVAASPGEEVSVSAWLIHNPGIAGMEFRINYDSSVMSYVSGKSDNNKFYTGFSETAGANPVKVVFANLSLKDISGDLALATITFKIADDAAKGKYTMTVSDFKAYDSDIAAIKTATENFVITVTE